MKNNEKNKEKNSQENKKTQDVTIATENFVLVVESKNKRKQYKLYVGAFGTKEKDKAEFSKIINELKKATKKDKITCYISSPGGAAEVGIRLVNVLKEKFFGRITTVSDYMASSMGSLLFCVGDKRIIHKYSRHMMHNYSTGYHTMKAEDLKTRVDFFDEHLEGFLKDVYVGQNILTKKEFKKLKKGKEYWFNAKDMLKRNIATHIILNGKEYNKKIGLKKLKRQ